MTDTGTVTSGIRDFTRFTKPAECLAAIADAEKVGRHSIAAQLAHEFQDSAVAGDTLPTTAVAVAQACLRRFSLAHTSAEQLPDLFSVALAAGNDSLAHDVLTKRLTLALSVTAKAAVLHTALEGYLSAQPRRVAAADSVVAAIDALGPAAAAARLRAHTTVLDRARGRFDEPTMRREAERIIALGHSLPFAAIQDSSWRAIRFAYTVLANLAFVESPDSMTAVLAGAKADLSRFPPQPKGFNFKTASLDQIRAAFVPFDAKVQVSPPPLTANYWFPKPPSAQALGQGHPALIVYGGWLLSNCVRDDASLINFSLRNECLALRTALPAWAARYGDRLPITLVTPTSGHAVRSLPLPPAAEADTIAWYLREWLKLPVTVGVVRDSVWREPQGRLRRLDTTAYGRLRKRVRENEYPNESVVLYGAQGELRYVGDFDVPLLRRLIAREMKMMTPGSTAR
jgi:hypothetical protein